MNELMTRSTTAGAERGRSRASDESVDGSRATDYERGVELFILAAATFFRDAAENPPRGRRRAKAAAVPTKRRTVAKRTAARASAKAE